jgi:hypothetical protein
VLISTCTFMAECNRLLEKTAYCIASLTVSAPDIIRIMEKRNKG